MTDRAHLSLGDAQYQFPIVEGSEGERAIDIRELRERTGHITLDPGYANTGSCQSAITFIDGEQGVLHYRGIPIEQFADEPNFRRPDLLEFTPSPVSAPGADSCAGTPLPSG